MKILDHVTLIVLFHLIYYLNHVDSSFEDSIQEMGDTHELDESRAEHSHHHHHLRYRKGHPHDYDTDDYDNCDCTCSKCQAPSPCCNNVCRSCASNMYQQQATGLSGQSQASVVFVPFPYPLMMASPMMKSMNHHTVMLAHHETTRESTTQSTTTPAQTTTSSTTTPTTTTETTTSAATSTTTANCSYSSDPLNPPYLKSQNNENVLDSVLKSVVDDYTNIIVKTPEKLRNGNNKYMLTSLRRTKPTWMPKFGIVPITDDMAVKLMSQLKARYPIRTQKRPVHDQH